MQAYLFVEVEWEAEPSAIKHLSCGTGYNLGEKHNCYIKDSTEKKLRTGQADPEPSVCYAAKDCFILVSLCSLFSIFLPIFSLLSLVLLEVSLF